MCIVILKQACCGCPLRTGSLFIAIFGLMGNIGEIITGVIVLMVGNDHSKGANRSGLFVQILFWGFACVQLIFNILMIVAIKQRRWNFVILMWLVETATVQLVLIGFSIFCFLNGAFLEASILLSAFGMRWYFWSVVFSFYREMKLEEENPSVGLNTIS